MGNSGKDMTASFFGGIYAHSHAAHNVRTTSLSAYPTTLTVDFLAPIPIDRSEFTHMFRHLAPRNDACGHPGRWRGGTSGTCRSTQSATRYPQQRLAMTQLLDAAVLLARVRQSTPVSM